MFEEKLCQIGFTRNEAKVYLELLKMGPQAVSIVAKKSSINRTTAYSVLKSLEKKGVISSYGNGKVQFFVAGDPNILVGYLDRKCRTFDYYRKELLTMVPHFRKLVNNYTFKKPIIRYFEGLEGVKYLMHDSSLSKDFLYSICPAHKWLDSKLKIFFADYGKSVRDRLHVKILLPNTPSVQDFVKNNFDCFKCPDILYFPLEKFEEMFENQINIYDNNVAIMNVNCGEEYGIMIESREFFHAQKAIFETLWNQHEKNKVKT